jgi:hypothetical protein
MKLQPAPLTTPIVDKTLLNSTWQTWMRNLSTNLVDSCTVKTGTSGNFVVNGSVITLKYIGIGFDLELPYKSSIDQIISFFQEVSPEVFEISYLTLLKDSQVISFPKVSIKVSENILVNQVNR